MSNHGPTGLLDVSLAFGKKQIFSHLNISIEPGEKVCITAPSGYGKSTFLNLLMGFERPDEGEVRVLGTKVDRQTIRTIRNKLSWLPQEVYIDAESGKELLLAPFDFKGNRQYLPDEEKIEEVLHALMLSPDLLSQSTDTLSGGQKQRLALASCILLNKPLLLLDEPTSALDDESVEHVADRLKNMSSFTLISASHDERWLKAMDRVIDLKEKNSHG